MTSGSVLIGCLVAACVWIDSMYLLMSRRRPRSKTMRVIRLLTACVCWTRNESEGTVLLAVSEPGWTKNRSGRVKLPARSTWSSTVLACCPFCNADSDAMMFTVRKQRAVLARGWESTNTYTDSSSCPNSDAASLFESAQASQRWTWRSWGHNARCEDVR